MTHDEMVEILKVAGFDYHEFYDNSVDGNVEIDFDDTFSETEAILTLPIDVPISGRGKTLDEMIANAKLNLKSIYNRHKRILDLYASKFQRAECSLKGKEAKNE